MVSTHEITPGDPLSATCVVVSDGSVRREGTDWNVHVQTKAALWCDAKDFHIATEMKVTHRASDASTEDEVVAQCREKLCDPLVP